MQHETVPYFQTVAGRRPTTTEGRALSAPNLADIKLRVKIP